MKNKIKNIIPIILIIVGIILLASPFVSQYFDKNKNDSVIENYKKKYEEMPDEEIVKLQDEAKEYNEFKTNSITTIGDEDAISYIDIPKINVHLPIFIGTGADTIEKGVGLLEKTSFPIGGSGNHSVLTTHSGMVNQTLFNDLDKLTEGDFFIINTFNEKLIYKVYNIVVCLPEEYTNYISFEKGHDYCTLITCTPTPVNTHRLLVLGERYEEEDTKASIDEYDNKNISSNTELIYAICLFTYVLVISITKRRANFEERKK